jgi:hypothetical protein
MAVDVAGRRATRFAKVVVDVWWWVGLVGCSFLGGMFLAAPLLTKPLGIVAHGDLGSLHIDGADGAPGAGLRLSIADDSASERPLTSPDTVRAADPVLTRERRAYLEFRTNRWGFFYLANVMFLPYMAAGLLAIHLLRSFLADVLSADVFTIQNAKRLSKIGWLVIVLGIAVPQLEYWRAWLILRTAQLGGAALSPADPDGNGIWLGGVLVLVLAAAWRYGAELQQDRDLTV